MSLALLLPIGLLALGALLLPLLIHLARRSEQRPTSFAALRWLRSVPRPRRRIRLDEWPLLLLRLGLLALLALWLARPALFGETADDAWVVVVPGVDLAQARALGGDAGVQRRWLAPGFPDLAQSAPPVAPPVASLLRQLDAELPGDVALTVAVPARLEGMDGQRPLLSRAVDWRVLPGAMPARETPERMPPPLTVRHAAGREQALRYLRAAALAWHPAEETPASESAGQAWSAAPTDRPLAPDARHLVWLAPGPLPAAIGDWIEGGGIALLDAETEVDLPATATVWWSDASGEPLVEGAASGRGRILRFTRPLSPARMQQLLEADFPQRLRALLDAPLPEPASVAAADHAPSTGASAYPQPPRELRPWLALLIALLFLLERWLATSRRRGAAP